jgi:hypothetical protein
MQPDSGLIRDTEAICRDFEASLAAETPSEIERLLSRWRRDPGGGALLVELLKMKIEHDLRHGSPTREFLATRARREYPEVPQTDFLDIVAHEYIVRWLLGHSIMVEDVVGCLGVDAATLRSCLMNAIAETTPADVIVFQAQVQTIDARLQGVMTVGRQARDEPPPFQLVRYGDHDKLVIAPTSDRHVSRHQLRLVYAAPGVVEISSARRGLGVRVNSQHRLRAETAVTVESSTLLEFGPFAIRINIPFRSDTSQGSSPN